jgi:hypothetical protein
VIRVAAIALCAVVAVATMGCQGRKKTPHPSPAAPSSIHPGELPSSGLEADLVGSRCVICHSLQYITQQRLGEPQWRKTIDKMRKFGAPLDEKEAAALTSALARAFAPEVPPPAFQLVATPAAALPPPQ